MLAEFPAVPGAGHPFHVIQKADVALGGNVQLVRQAEQGRQIGQAYRLARLHLKLGWIARFVQQVRLPVAPTDLDHCLRIGFVGKIKHMPILFQVKAGQLLVVAPHRPGPGVVICRLLKTQYRPELLKV